MHDPVRSRTRFTRQAPVLLSAASLLALTACGSSSGSSGGSAKNTTAAPTSVSSTATSPAAASPTASGSSSAAPGSSTAPAPSSASTGSAGPSASADPYAGLQLTEIQKRVLASLKFPRPPVAGKNYTIGVAQISTTIPFLAVLDKAVEAEAQKLGMKTTILNADLKDSQQSSNIENLIAKKVSVILIDGGTPTALNGAIKDANRANIPVIAVNGALDTTGKLVTYAGDSDFDYGVGEGNLMVKALPNGGKIAIILGILGGAPEVNRLAGIKSVLKSHPNIKIVATPTDTFDNNKNLAVTQDLLSKYPKGSLDGVIAEGPEMYVGAKYARSVGRTDIAFVAGDYSTQVRDAIKSGALYGTVNQDPGLEGRLGADYAYDVLTGNTARIPAPEALIPLPLITKDNVDQNPTTWSG